MTVKETLTKARDILAERGVNRNGWFVDPESCKVCAYGAVYLALGGKVTINEYTELEFDPETGYDVPVTVKDSDIGGYDWRAVEPVRKALNWALDDLGLHTPAWGHGIVTSYNDLTTSDDQVLALFDHAINNYNGE